MNDKRRFLKSNRSLLVILSVVSALLTVYFMPAHRQEKYTFTVGKPWTYDVLIAPFNFSIQKSDEVWQAEADSVKASFAPYFSRNASVSETALARFDKFYNDSLSKVVWEESYLSLRRRLEKVYREGIIWSLMPRYMCMTDTRSCSTTLSSISSPIWYMTRPVQRPTLHPS